MPLTRCNLRLGRLPGPEGENAGDLGGEYNHPFGCSLEFAPLVAVSSTCIWVQYYKNGGKQRESDRSRRSLQPFGAQLRRPYQFVSILVFTGLLQGRVQFVRGKGLLDDFTPVVR